MSESIVALEISSFAAALGRGATHYYGTLTGYRDGEYIRIDVQAPLTEDEAKALNTEDTWRGHRAGIMSGRFSTKTKLVRTAKEMYKIYFPKAIVLVAGRLSVWGPQELLACDSDSVGDELAVLYNRSEEIGWGVKNLELFDAICEEWDAILHKLGEVTP